MYINHEAVKNTHAMFDALASNHKSPASSSARSAMPVDGGFATVVPAIEATGADPADPGLPELDEPAD